MIKRIIKSCIFEVEKHYGIYNYTRKLRRGATVIYYHGVEHNIVDPIIQHPNISLQTFEKHITYLRQHYEIISLDYLYECMSNGYKLNSSQVVITFDDGYKNNRNIVAPFLMAYNAPFTVFISTKHIDSGVRFPNYCVAASIMLTKLDYIDIPSIKLKLDVSNFNKRILAKNIISKTLKASSQSIVNQILKDLIN